ncbi:MAG: alpha-glucosidase [Actinomycetia bacterium]|nr:alpha-glucosidase [Actinomycetes bacterium]
MTLSIAEAALRGRPDRWWRNAVVYQIYPRSFADANGDGIGDLKGILEQLDYLALLGVDVVWLSPVYQSPQDDNGYDICDYQQVDPLFGSLDDLDRLIEGLHERGIKLVLDLVVNHTSDEHAWFQESRDPASEKRDWYWWRPAREGHQPGTPGAEPTNWGSFFSGPGWQHDPASDEYYLHLFSRKQPDLNWENPEVRQAVFQMMRWWLDRGIDGFRMDVINLISKPELADGPVAPGATISYEARMVADGPRMHDFLGEMKREVLDGQNLLTVGETPMVTVEKAAEYTHPETGELSMVFQFEHVGLDHGPGGRFDRREWSWVAYKENVTRWDKGIGEGWNSLYLENHDQPRSVSRMGDDSPRFREACAKTLGSVLHLQRGTPYIYQGQELGMTNYPFEALGDFRDIESLGFFAEATASGVPAEALLPALAWGSRDNARTPMQWSSQVNAGFSETGPWIAVNPNHIEINAADQIRDQESVFHHYRRLIQLRHDLEVVRTGEQTVLHAGDPSTFLCLRTLGDQRVLLLANVSSEPVRLPADLPDHGAGEVLLATHEIDDVDTLQPWESRVVRL